MRAARAPGQDDDASLIEVSQAAPADVRFGRGVHRDGRLQTRVDLEPFQGILEREAVDHGGQHAHRVAHGRIHARAQDLAAADDVATADDNGKLYPRPAYPRHLACDRVRALWIKAPAVGGA